MNWSTTECCLIYYIPLCRRAPLLDHLNSAALPFLFVFSYEACVILVQTCVDFAVFVLFFRSYLELELRKERERRSGAASRQPSTPQRERRHPENIPKVNQITKLKISLVTAVFFFFIQYMCILPTVSPRVSISQKGEWPVTLRSRGQNKSELQLVSSFKTWIFRKI